MKMRLWLPILIVALLPAHPAWAREAPREIDCQAGDTLTRALQAARPGDEFIINGVCHEAVRITTDEVTLRGGESGELDGGGQDVVTVDGAQRVVVADLRIRNGHRGLLVRGNASVALHNTTVQHNTDSGIRVEASASLEATGSLTSDNGLNGLEVDRHAEVQLRDTFISRDNALFGIILNNGSSMTFSDATVTVERNILGIQIGVKSSAFISDRNTTVTTSSNLTTGCTVVAGSTLFVFEGAIVAENNGFNHGVSASSNSTIDLDRTGAITARNNGQDGVFLENSALNMFNMPGFTGSRVVATGNRRHGMSAFVGSKIDVSGDGVITSQQNGDAGLLADNGSAVHVINSTITGNRPGRDIVLTFGARADLAQNPALGSITCDETVLIRGDTVTVCPTP
jgi:Periplasmic copper-binding protein (NosD)